jgi:hypothetical protein
MHSAHRKIEKERQLADGREERGREEPNVAEILYR